ncbi:MAG: class IV adenylate cyclase [Anaerolineales bacterium]|jgi:adenylate cyclase class 2
MNAAPSPLQAPDPGHQELEVKFRLLEPDLLPQRLAAAQAACVRTQELEVNLRYDTPDRDLTRRHRVLRLRRDRSARLTYKEPGPTEGTLEARREVEFIVSDAGAAQELLERLGYECLWRYEKYREEWELGQARIMLDRLPFGSFLEIEGPSEAALKQAALGLGLDWSQAFQGSYLSIFTYLREAHSLPFRDLTFANFRDLPPFDLGLPQSAWHPLTGGDHGG